MSQESSPITQWLYEIRELVHDKVSVNHHFMCLRLEHEENSAIPDDCSCGAEYKEIQALTSATIELIEGLIGEDDDPNEVFTDDFSGEKRHAFWNASRNSLRQELRQSLKELSE